MPYVVRSFVNDQLEDIQGFRGHVQKIRMNLWRGAYTIINLRLLKASGKTPVPFITLPEMDFEIEWRQLFKGALVTQITVTRPVVNFVAGPTQKQKQTGLHRNWKQVLQNIAPFTINRFQVNDGSLRFLDPYRTPKVDIYVTNLFATATNLTNVRHQGGPLPSGLLAHGNTIGGGLLHLELHMNPLAHAPTFKLLTTLTNVDLTSLNNFLEAYAGFSVAAGTFSLVVNVAADHERYQGYAKPFFFDMAVFSLPKEVHETPWHVVWDAVVALITRIFRNQPYNQLATVVPISGVFKRGSTIDLATTIGGILQNAFVQALSPKLIPPVGLPAATPATSQAAK